MRDTAELSVRIHEEILPSLSVVLLPNDVYSPSEVRIDRVAETFDAGRPLVVSRI